MLLRALSNNFVVRILAVFAAIVITLPLLRASMPETITLPSVEAHGSKGQQKEDVCHIPPGNYGARHTINISMSAVKAHLKHGDYMGSCVFDQDGSDNSDNDDDSDDNDDGENSDNNDGGDGGDENEEQNDSGSEEDGTTGSDNNDDESSQDNGDDAEDSSDSQDDDEETDDNNGNGDDDSDDQSNSGDNGSNNEDDNGSGTNNSGSGGADENNEEDQSDNGNEDQDGNGEECSACGGQGGGGSTSNQSNSGGGSSRGGGGLTHSNLLVINEMAVWAGQVIVVTWETSVPATSRVYFGTSSPKTLTLDPDTIGYATSTQLIASTTKLHTVAIHGADRNETYYLRPSSQLSPIYGIRALGRELVLAPSTEQVKSNIDGDASSDEQGSVDIEIVSNCAAYLTSYIKFNEQNDRDQVIRLQQFLREVEGFTNTPQNGVYDEVTRELVNAFQQRYRTDILDSWGLEIPTGYVYITTQKRINERYCEFLSIQTEFPLSEAQRSEIVSFRTQLEIERALRAEPAWEPKSPQVGFNDPSGEDSGSAMVDAGSTIGDSEDEDISDPLLVVEDSEIATDAGIKDILDLPDFEKEATSSASTTRAGLLGALGGFVTGGFSTPGFLGILSVFLLVLGAIILSKSLRGADDMVKEELFDTSEDNNASAPINLPTEQNDNFLDSNKKGDMQ